MNHAVVNKQENSAHCLVCGLKNEFGLKASFYELASGELVALYSPLDQHQSYPNRLHGGIAGALLDETIGRAIRILERDIFGVTVELTLKYHKPIPLDQQLRIVGRITNNTSRIFEGTGEILLPDGSIGVSASGKYLKMPIEKIADFNVEEQEWRVVAMQNDPSRIEL
jgi:acyl-coenzyme A thioesterase PaaI-like protein